MKLLRLRILSLTILAYSLISCSQFIGYYAKTYSGKPLSRDSVAILSGVVFPYPDDENKSWGERNSNMTIIQIVDGKDIKGLNW